MEMLFDVTPCVLLGRACTAELVELLELFDPLEHAAARSATARSTATAPPSGRDLLWFDAFMPTASFISGFAVSGCW
jgi:hypothetical protein